MTTQAFTDTIHRIHNRYGKGEIHEIRFTEFCDDAHNHPTGGMVIGRLCITQTSGVSWAKPFVILHGDFSKIRYMGRTRRVRITL